MTSLTSSAYGSRVARHGSGRRTRAYQSSSAPVSKVTGAMTVTGRGERQLRLGKEAGVPVGAGSDPVGLR